MIILCLLQDDGLYCRVCDMYFNSQHNRKEHFYGKQHLQNVVSKLTYDPKFTVKEFMLHPKSLGVPDFLQQQLMK